MPALRSRYALALPESRKMDLEPGWANMRNTRQYQASFVSPFQLAQPTYALRPVQVLASVRLSL